MVLSAIAILFRYLAWKCERITVEANETEMGRMMSRVERRRDWMLTKFIPLVTTADLKPQPEVRSMVSCLRSVMKDRILIHVDVGIRRSDGHLLDFFEQFFRQRNAANLMSARYSRKMQAVH